MTSPFASRCTTAAARGRCLAVATLSLAGLALADGAFAQNSSTLARPRPTPTPTQTTADDGKPVRRAQRVTPEESAASRNDETVTPEELLSRPFSVTPPPAGAQTPNVRRAVPVAPAEIRRPPEPTGPKDDATTIRLSPSTGGQPSTTPDELQIDIANNLYARKQFDQAAPEYEKYLNVFPTAAQRQAALYRLGECYRQLNRMAAATSCYRNLLVEAKESGDFVGPANYRLGTVYYGDKDYRSAYPHFQRSAQLAKANDVLLASIYYQALCLEKLDRHLETREIYERIAEIGGDNPYRDFARLSLGTQAYAEGRKLEALRQFEALSRDASKETLKAEATLKAGLLASELGQFDAATGFLQKVIDWPGTEINAATRGDARLGLLRLYYRANKYPQLLTAYESFKAQLSPENRAEAMLLAGNAQRQLDKPAEALAIYNQLLKEFPRSPQAADVAFQRVVTLYTSNDPGLSKATDDFLLTNPDPDKADKVRLIKAELLFKKEKFAEAAAAYSQVQESAYIEPKYRAEAMYRVGYCYNQLKLPDQVIEAYSRFLRAFPESPLAAKALTQRGLSYQQFRNFPAALQDFNTLLIDFPKSKEREIALRQKALLQGQLEDSKGMVDTFRLLLKDFPQTDSAGLANYWIGRTSFEAKNYPQAVSALEAARADKEFAAKSWMLLILSYFNAQDRDKLEAEATEYVKAGISPAIPAQVLNDLGSYLFELRKYDRAEPFLAAAAASPTNVVADVWLVLARCRLFLRDYAGAKTASESYLETKPVLPAAKAQGLLAHGEALVGLGKFDDAQKNAEEALTLQPEGRLNAEGRLLTGQVSLGRGNALEAAKAFQAVSVLYDDPDLTPRALALAAQAYRRANKAADAAKIEDELKTRFPSYAGLGGA
jgi:tetratricopeptide (TPR) repeat protein